MKKLLSFLLLCFLSWNINAQFMNRFLNGFSSPVYRTLTNFDVTEAGIPAHTYTIAANMRYRVLSNKDGTLKIKILPWAKKEGNMIKIATKSSNNDLSVTTALYEVEIDDLEPENHIWQQGLAWSLLVLPVKYRPKRTFNGIDYERAFTTDISVGPFFGYKFKIGESFDQFIKLGFFAGPTLVSYPTIDGESVIISSTNTAGEDGDAIDSEIENPNDVVTTDNLIGYSAGYGVVYQYNAAQIGFVVGKDWLGGKKSSQWRYDGKTWFSFAIGYKFIN